MDCLFNIKFINKSGKEFSKLDTAIKQKVWQKILELENFSKNSRNIKRLVTNSGEYYRLRVSDYRILFEVDWNQRKIWILTVGHRREVYK